MGRIPSGPVAALRSPLRPTTTATLNTTTPSRLTPTTQIRNATFIRRPRRPYTFTQLIQLSDGSSYTVRTTSPQTLYRSAKDTRNALLWQPSERSLRNVELDEAGKLAAFRERFGHAFERSAQEGAVGKDGEKKNEVNAAAGDSFADLITGYASTDDGSMKDHSKTDPKKKRK